MKQTLTFHRIEPRFTWSVSNYNPARFKRLLERLSDNCNAPLHERFNLTFDDAYESVYQYAAPILCEFNLTATIFVPTAFIGQTNKWDYTKSVAPARHMSASQLSELSDCGFSIQSHTHCHCDLSRSPVESIRSELIISKDILEQVIGREVTQIAFPYGSYNDSVERIAAECGYRQGWNMNPAHSTNFTGSRWPIYSFDTALSVSHKHPDAAFSVLESGKSRLIGRLSRLNRYAFWAEQPNVTIDTERDSQISHACPK